MRVKTIVSSLFARARSRRHPCQGTIALIRVIYSYVRVIVTLFAFVIASFSTFYRNLLKRGKKVNNKRKKVTGSNSVLRDGLRSSEASFMMSDQILEEVCLYIVVSLVHRTSYSTLKKRRIARTSPTPSPLVLSVSYLRVGFDFSQRFDDC